MRPLADPRSIGSVDLALLVLLPGAGALPVAARGRAHLVDMHLYDAPVAANPVNIPFIPARPGSIRATTPLS